MTVRVEADDLLGGDDPTCKHPLDPVDRIGGDWPSVEDLQTTCNALGRPLDLATLTNRDR